MRPEGMMHHQDGRLDIHDVVLLCVVEQPVVEEGELGVAGGDLIGAGCEEPAYHGPPEDHYQYQYGGWNCDYEDYNTWG